MKTKNKGKKAMALLLSLIMVMTSAHMEGYNAKAEETGVIVISSAEELGRIGNDDAYPMDGDYILGEDVTEVQITIGTSSTPFTGTFDGDGHSITFQISDAPNYTGLFGYIKGAYVKNVVVKGSMNVQYGWTAGITAKAEDSTITNCGSEVTIHSDGSNSTCFAGIAGYAKNTTITNCYNAGNIDGKIKNAGGIAGQTNTSVDIENCYNTGKISTTATSAQRVGGIVGYGAVSTGNTGKLYNCYSCGMIEGTGQTGAFIGYIYTGFEAKNCYYLEGTHNNAFGFQYEADTSGICAVNEEALKELAVVLGESFTANTDLNNGYPVLVWQIPNTDAEDLATLNALVEKLPSSALRPNFYSDKNIAQYVEDKIDALEDYKDKNIGVSVKTAVPRKDNALAGIDADGTIHYVYMDLFHTSATTINNDKVTWIDVVFELTLNQVSVEYQPMGVALRWDLDKVQEDVQKVADGYVPESILAENTSLDEVTTNLKLPYYPVVRMESENEDEEIKWVKTTYTSSNPNVIAIAENKTLDDSYSSPYYEAIVNRQEENVDVTLTANIEFDRYDETYGEEKIRESITKEITVTVVADDEKAELKNLQNCVKDYENHLSDFNLKSAVDLNAVKNDIQLAIPKDLGLDGKYYEIKVESSDASVVDVYGYRTFTYRPLPGESPKDVTLNITVTKKDNPSITASTAVTLTVVPLTEQEIDDALAFMDKAKSELFNLIKNENTDADNVTTDLETFYGIYQAEDGNVFSTTYVDKPNNNGIIKKIINPEEVVPDYLRYWYSSNEDIIHNETLKVTIPKYDTKVTLGVVLSYETYENYADRYEDDPVYGEIFKKLTDQKVCLELTVKGSDGKEPESETTEKTWENSGNEIVTTEKADNEEIFTTKKDDNSQIKKLLKVKKVKLKKRKKSIKVTWKKNKYADGYRIIYSRSKKFKKSKKISVLSKSKTFRVIKKLKRKKVYYVKVRAYKVVDGKHIYGKWSKRKKITTK